MWFPNNTLVAPLERDSKKPQSINMSLLRSEITAPDPARVVVQQHVAPPERNPGA